MGPVRGVFKVFEYHMGSGKSILGPFRGQFLVFWDNLKCFGQVSGPFTVLLRVRGPFQVFWTVYSIQGPLGDS